MSKERADQDPVITAYVVKRIRQWQIEKRKLKDLAALGGMSKTVPSQILAGDMGVGARTRARLATAFGFPDVAAFREAAQASWDAERSGRTLTAAQEDAILALVGLNQGSREHIQEIMSAYSIARFHDRDAQWWVDTILPELAHDRSAMRAEGLTHKRELAAQGKVRKEKRALTAARAAASEAATKHVAPRKRRTG